MKNQSGRCSRIFIVHKNFLHGSDPPVPSDLTIARAEKQQKTGNLITPWKESTVHYITNVMCHALNQMSWLTSIHWEYLQGTFTYMPYLATWTTNWLYNWLYHWLYYYKTILFHSIPFHIPCISYSIPMLHAFGCVILVAIATFSKNLLPV